MTWVATEVVNGGEGSDEEEEVVVDEVVAEGGEVAPKEDLTGLGSETLNDTVAATKRK